ncbi:CST complex subunit TEN1 [Brachyhypopomus gauderio]|uniref:CST complex subunit TEN1 n=1 Tax=Brachyhypopomus gauderio TaxID=698409 RepID=UPI0040410015
MLPAPAPFHLPWEIQTDAVKDGASLRTFGRLTGYLPGESMAVLTCVRASVQHQVSVRTTSVEPFHPITGAQYTVLGEIEKTDDGETILHARVLNCVDGVDVALLQKAIEEQRNFFKERDDVGTE